ncbi:MAG: hypothetical protein N2376_06120 [Clostridia bacterium]|nr:hypothetical protein [Clostridia bacterium]
MLKKAMFERDILYPTQKPFEPGSVHITVYAPESSGGIPVVIEAKTQHNPLDYIPDILSILQTDVFDRIRIDVKNSGILFFKASNGNYFRVRFTDKDRYSVEEIHDNDPLV